MKIAKKPVFAWCLYDWANSAFPTIITTFLFAAYFTQSVATDVHTGTAQWGYTITVSGILIALLSPVFGSIADHYGQRKPWLAAFTSIAVVASALLWFVKPTPDSTQFALQLVIIGTVGFEIAAVFYNAMLHDLAPPAYYGRISGWGWGLGYLGGLGCLLIALLLIQPNIAAFLNLNTQTAEHIRISGPLVGVWFTLFAIPLFLWVKDQPSQLTLVPAVKKGTQQFWKSLKNIAHHKNIFIFLIAHMIYIDGLNTIFAFGGIYAAGTFGFTAFQLIIFGIAMNIGAGLGAAIFAWVDDIIGPKKMILIAILGLLTTGAGLLLVEQLSWFWSLALVLSLFVGPVQASSRSLLTHIVPEHMTNEVFGLYAFSGKATAFIGPWVLGWVTYHFSSQRLGMASTFVFLIIGGLLLIKVKKVIE